jgi:restriction system protein
MAIPTYDQFIEPLLRFLGGRPDGAKTSEVYVALADAVGLTDEERDDRLPSSGRQPRHQNRIGWAHDRMKRQGLSQSIERGTWQLTDKGRKFLADHPNALDEEEIAAIVKVEPGSRVDPDAPPKMPVGPPPPVEASSPDERIDEALEELNDSVASDLLDLIARSSPTFFEHLVLDLLHALGYGITRSDLQQVGGSNDAGIDGIVSLDRLGFEKVYVQAKRWQNTVTRPEIQSFYGALAGKRAKKGVFITTSTFTTGAKDYAHNVSDSIVLLDGPRLALLMIEHGVGVTHRPLKVAQVDSDYFEELS